MYEFSVSDLGKIFVVFVVVYIVYLLFVAQNE